MISETIKGIDKTKRYGWTTKDEPGELKYLHKDMLKIHPAYQREVALNKVTDITANWSWVGAGVIVVGERNGEYWVIDGQHRLLSAKRRSDITSLPCIVFSTESIKQEAIAFLDLNTNRKPVSSVAKYRGMTAAEDETAVIVTNVFNKLGIKATSNGPKAKEIKSVAWALKRAKEDAYTFELIMTIAAKLCEDMPIHERLIGGLWYMHKNLPYGINDKKLMERINNIGARKLVDAANRAAAYFSRGGEKVWATGMLEEINKGLRNKFEFEAKQ